jgi:hypothetical protein
VGLFLEIPCGNNFPYLPQNPSSHRKPGLGRQALGGVKDLWGSEEKDIFEIVYHWLYLCTFL